LSGSLQGAGGIGGLLCASSGTGSAKRLYSYDANGNVGALLEADGTMVAHYEYDPYGKALVADGPAAKANPYRFSTKYSDDETSLYYYGYRYYSADVGRWVSRDPIAEKGGNNVYQMSYNNIINFIDADGRVPLWVTILLTFTTSATGLVDTFYDEAMVNCANKCTKSDCLNCCATAKTVASVALSTSYGIATAGCAAFLLIPWPAGPVIATACMAAQTAMFVGTANDITSTYSTCVTSCAGKP
jgi:RHS repeat-associated protein